MCIFRGTTDAWDILITEPPDYRLNRCSDPFSHFIQPGRQRFSRML